MNAPACLVGRLGADGPWVGFTPSLDDGYDLVVGTDASARRTPAAPDDLLSLAIAYFEEALEEPPEEMAATLGDIGALVRHVAGAARDDARRRVLDEAVDAVDDGLAADAVVGRLTACLEGGDEPVARLGRRATQLLGGV